MRALGVQPEGGGVLALAHLVDGGVHVPPHVTTFKGCASYGSLLLGGGGMGGGGGPAGLRVDLIGADVYGEVGSLRLGVAVLVDEALGDAVAELR